jgi:hypothetical protein
VYLQTDTTILKTIFFPIFLRGEKILSVPRRSQAVPSDRSGPTTSPCPPFGKSKGRLPCDAPFPALCANLSRRLMGLHRSMTREHDCGRAACRPRASGFTLQIAIHQFSNWPNLAPSAYFHIVFPAFLIQAVLRYRSSPSLLGERVGVRASVAHHRHRANTFPRPPSFVKTPLFNPRKIAQRWVHRSGKPIQARQGRQNYALIQPKEQCSQSRRLNSSNSLASSAAVISP